MGPNIGKTSFTISQTLTVIAVIISAYMAMNACSSLSLAHNTFKAANAPEVIVYLRPHDSLDQSTELVVNNVGNGPALNFKFTDHTVNLQERKDSMGRRVANLLPVWLETERKIIPPGQQISTLYSISEAAESTVTEKQSGNKIAVDPRVHTSPTAQPSLRESIPEKGNVKEFPKNACGGLNSGGLPELLELKYTWVDKNEENYSGKSVLRFSEMCGTTYFQPANKSLFLSCMNFQLSLRNSQGENKISDYSHLEKTCREMI